VNYKAFVGVLLLSAHVAAQATPAIPVPHLELKYEPPPLVAVPAGEDKIVPLKLNQPAPFTGELFDLPTAVRFGHFIEQARLRLKEDVLLERRRCNAEMSYLGQRANLERDLRLSEEADYRMRILKLENTNIQLQNSINNPGLLQSPVFWLITGALGASLLFGISAYAMR
jgi:hypothetical protein